jgi:hypothetical protein
MLEKGKIIVDFEPVSKLRERTLSQLRKLRLLKS